MNVVLCLYRIYISQEHKMPRHPLVCKDSLHCFTPKPTYTARLRLLFGGKYTAHLGTKCIYIWQDQHRFVTQQRDEETSSAFAKCTFSNTTTTPISPLKKKKVTKIKSSNYCEAMAHATRTKFQSLKPTPVVPHAPFRLIRTSSLGKIKFRLINNERSKEAHHRAVYNHAISSILGQTKN